MDAESLLNPSTCEINLLDIIRRQTGLWDPSDSDDSLSSDDDLHTANSLVESPTVLVPLLPAIEKKPKRRWVSRGHGSAKYKQDRWIRGLEKEMRTIFDEAMANPHFAGNQYNVREGIQRRRDNNIEKDNGLSRGWTTLSATLPSVALDTDAELAYVFLPGAIKQRGKDALTSTLMALPNHFKLDRGTGADQHGRGKASSYIYREGEHTGAIILAHWKPVGHTTGVLLPSKNQVTGSYNFVHSRSLVRALLGLGVRLNALLRCISPPVWAASHALRLATLEKYDWAKDLMRDDPLLMHGISIGFNRQTESHTDSQGPYGEWTPLVALGFSVGVKIRLAGLKEMLPFEPGTIVFIRGGEIAHGIEAWSGGQRVAVACFTHQYIWDEFNMEYPWSHPFLDALHVITPM